MLFIPLAILPFDLELSLDAIILVELVIVVGGVDKDLIMWRVSTCLFFEQSHVLSLS